MQGLSLSQYVPGDSIMHAMDPRSKLIAILLLSVGVFAARGLTELVFVTVLGMLLAALCRISAMYYWKALRPFMIIIIPAALLQALFISGPTVFKFGSLAISRTGLVTAGIFVLRFTLLIIILRLLTLTTTPTAIINGLERMLYPLSKTGFPVAELLMIMNLTMAFIPFFLEEGERVRMAQTSRGMSLQEGSLKKRLEGMLSLLVPLWRGAFERSAQLAEAMEARGYSGGKPRTHLHILRWGFADYVAAVLGSAALMLVLVH